MHSYAAKNRDNGSACWHEPFDSKKQKLVTPQLRAALAKLLETDPDRFIAACVAAQVTSLRQIQAWRELLVTDPWRAAEIAVLAENAGIEHQK